MEKILNKIIVWGVAALAFVIPLFFLPFTANFYDFNKNFFLCFVSLLLLVVWFLKILFTQQIKLTKTPFDFPILLFGFSFILSTIFASPNKIEAFLYPGGTVTVLALCLLFPVITNSIFSQEQRKIKSALIASAIVLSIIAVLQFIGFSEAYLSVPWLKSRLWTPVGDTLVLIMFLVAVLPLIIIPFVKNFSKSVPQTIGLGFMAIIVSVGLILTIYQVQTLMILPYSASWSIAVESFKQNPFFGVGPENFVSAFNRFRPISFNSYDFWNVRFANSTSFLLHLLTTTGFLGLMSFVWLALKLLKQKPQAQNLPIFLSLLISLLLLVALPANFLLLFIFFLLLGLFSANSQTTSRLDINLSHILKKVLLITSLVLLITCFYFGGRSFAAEVYFKQSLDTLAQNKGIPTYNLQTKAIGLNPKNVAFRTAYSQTNLALANALAAKKDLTDQDRANVTRLVQQAINEAKAATVLNPTDAANWENLANVYRSLINFAQGADQWAVASYQQAVTTDPINPRMRLNLGGFYFTLAKYDSATRLFQDAINLKPDYANAYYNLAAAYKEGKKYQEAYSALLNTVDLVPFDSADYQKAKSELDELAKKLPGAQATPSAKQASSPEEALTQPEPLPSPAIQPPIELPEESQPPTQEPIPTTQPNQ